MASFTLSSNPTISEIHSLYFQKTAKVVEIIEYFLSKIVHGDGEIQSVVRMNSKVALKLAKNLDEELQLILFEDLIKSKPLFGIPFALKDNVLIQDQPLTAQSRILEGYIASYSSDIYKHLEDAGAILVAQTNMDEFAFGSSTEYSGYGQITHNPHDLSRVPGGTSGGSAAIVAAGLVPFAIGTDTGGSIRQPASFCGVYGIRPTYGTVSRFGIVASASSFDQAGPLANSLEDCETILNVLKGKSQKDQTIVEKKPQSMSRKVLGIPKQFFGEGLDTEVRNIIQTSIDKLAQTYSIKEIELPYSDQTLSVYYILQTVEAAANLERFDGVRYGKQVENGELFFASRGEYLGHETQKRIMLGTYTSSAGYYDAYYNKACQVRELIRRDYEKAFEEVDALLMPVSPFPAFKIGENTTDPLAMYLADTMTTSHPIAKIPGLSVPVGKISNLPVGLQIVGKEFGDDVLFEVARNLIYKKST
jgi:aspartyl-tRNA(Asn)/glutamyl-tRNA(Gln) amidotransferase subunit A